MLERPMMSQRTDPMHRMAGAEVFGACVMETYCRLWQNFASVFAALPL
jgi:hypothetical protein